MQLIFIHGSGGSKESWFHQTQYFNSMCAQPYEDYLYRVGVALIDGDVRLSGIGTLTCREGNRILAFGHPMFQAGNPARM